MNYGKPTGSDLRIIRDPLRDQMMAELQRVGYRFEGELMFPPERAAYAQRDELCELLRRRIYAQPRFSFLSPPGGGVTRVPDSHGRWIEVDEAAALCEVEAVDAMLEEAGVVAADNINAPPMRVRAYVQVLEAECDPDGMVADSTIKADLICELSESNRRLRDALESSGPFAPDPLAIIAAPAGWTFTRIDERNISVTCPTFSTPLVLSLDVHDRHLRAFYSLAADLAERVEQAPAEGDSQHDLREAAKQAGVDMGRQDLRDAVWLGYTAALAAQPQPKGMPTNALAGAVCSVAEARGYVAFGAGVYRIQETQEPGLVVTFRRDGEQHFGVGDLAPEVDTTPILADDIIVRLQFTSAAGLDSLEHHLRSIRAQHWPETVQATAPAAANELADQLCWWVNNTSGHPDELMTKAAAELRRLAAVEAAQAPAVKDERQNCGNGCDCLTRCGDVYAHAAEQERKDAARYRFIRDANRCDRYVEYDHLIAHVTEELDSLIDKALEEEAASQPPVQGKS